MSDETTVIDDNSNTSQIQRPAVFPNGYRPSKPGYPKTPLVRRKQRVNRVGRSGGGCGSCGGRNP